MLFTRNSFQIGSLKVKEGEKIYHATLVKRKQDYLYE